MNEKEKFDDLLRSKLSERDFPFDETNWDKAEAAIERSEKRRRIGIIAAIFLAGLLVGIGIMYPFVHTSNKTELVSNGISTAGNNNNVAVNNTNTISTGNTTSHKEETINTTGTSTAAANLGTTTPQVQQQSVANTQSNAIATSTPKGRANSNQGVSASQTQQIVVNSPNKSSNPAETVDATAPIKKEKEKHKKHKTVSDTDAIAVSYVRPSTVTKTITSTSDNNTSLSQMSDNNATINATTIAGTHSTKESDNGAVQKIDTSNSTYTNTAKSTNTQIDTNKKKDSTATTFVVNKKDSDKSKTGQNVIPQKPDTSWKNHTTVDVDAGTNYSLGWMKAGALQGNGFNPILGISITRSINSKISGLAGLQFNTLGSINTLYSSNSNIYSFGLENGVNSVTIKTLFYLALPLKVQYNINSNNCVSIGAHISYLITSYSNIVSYTQDYYGRSGYISAYKTGYTDGINPWDVQITLAYKRKINRFGITAEAYYGLLDIENNSFFNNNTFERNSGLRLLLSYDIIK